MSRPQQLERPAVNPTHVASEAPEVVASPRPKPAAIASLEQLSFEPAVGQVSATGSLSQGRERIVGRGTASDVLDGRVAIERPSSDDGVDVKLVAVDDSVTRNASSAGLAFKLDLNGQPANIGARSAAESWELEFDLGLFVESLDDPTAVQFAAKSGCDKAGVCTESEWLDTSIDLDAEVALVSVPGELLGRLSAAAAADEAPLEDEQGAASTTTAEASLLLAATAGTSGEAGNFSASLLESLSSYQVGMPTGQAELTYPIPLPAAPGHVPDLTLRYSSGLVDGVNREKNSQASRAGLGWVGPTAAITRETKECDAYGSQALCPAHGRHDGFSVNFGGVSSPLIRITSDSQGYGHPDYSSSDVKAWDYVTQVKNDWRIRRVEQPSLANNASKNNGDAWTAWWEITTGDGVLHVFGRERVFNPTKVTSLPATQRTAFSNADSIYRSSELGAIRNAHASGVATEVRIGGTTVLYEPGMPASGMTLFGEDAFVLGPHAFVSEAELAQTLLHESHRLATSARSGSALVTSETQSAFDFAAQNYHALLGG